MERGDACLTGSTGANFGEPLGLTLGPRDGERAAALGPCLGERGAALGATAALAGAAAAALAGAPLATNTLRSLGAHTWNSFSYSVKETLTPLGLTSVTWAG